MRYSIILTIDFDGPITPGEVEDLLRETLPDDTILEFLSNGTRKEAVISTPFGISIRKIED